MNAWRLLLVTAAASAALAGCDYRDATTTTSAPPPQASAPGTAPAEADSSRTASAPVAEQPAAPVDATPTPVQPTTTAEAPTTTAEASSTQAMGAPAAPAPSDGTAAQTELGRFLEESARSPAARPAS